MKAKARNGKVDFYKFIFSIVVILYHFGNAVKYDYKLFPRGYIAVEFFFIVSGFLFAKSLSKYEYNKDTLIKNSLSFMGKKYRSFLPYHFFVCIATFALCCISYGWSFKELCFNVINSLSDIFLVQMCGISHMSLLGHEWYLSAMILAMFILTPILIKFRRNYSCYMAPIIAFVILGLLSNNYGTLNTVKAWNGFVYSGLLRAIAEISLGCICYAIYESKFFERFNKVILIIMELLIYIGVLIYANGCSDISLEFPIVCFIAVGVTISFCDKASIGFLNNRFILFLGKLSFPIYLNQLWVRQIIAKLDWPYGYWTHALFYIAAVIAASLLCILIMDSITYLIEKNKNKKRTA